MNQAQIKEAAAFNDAHKQAEQITKNYANKDYKFVYRMWGSMTKNPLFIGRYGMPNEVNTVTNEATKYVTWFRTKEECLAYALAVTNFKRLLDPSQTLQIRLEEGTMTDMRTLTYVTLNYKGKDYEVRADYGYGYPMGAAIFDWEESGSAGFDRRFHAINQFHPGVVSQAELDGLGDNEANMPRVVGIKLVLLP